jgi:predicted nucleotidyltransferase
MTSKFELSPERIAQYRRTFDRRAQARHQASERRRQQARQCIVEAIRMVMPRYPTVSRVYLFGSVIRPTAFRPDSDIDVGIEGADMALCFDIWRDLEQLVLDWRLDVRSLGPDESFTERIRQKGELVYEPSVSTP